MWHCPLYPSASRASLSRLSTVTAIDHRLVALWLAATFTQHSKNLTFLIAIEIEVQFEIEIELRVICPQEVDRTGVRLGLLLLLLLGIVRQLNGWPNGLGQLSFVSLCVARFGCHTEHRSQKAAQPRSDRWLQFIGQKLATHLWDISRTIKPAVDCTQANL